MRNGEHILIVDTPEEQATAITQLLQDPHIHPGSQPMRSDW